LDPIYGHTALALMLDVVGEKAYAAQIWDRGLKLLRCHRQGVPTLLGLTVIAVARNQPRHGNSDVAVLPPGHQKYVLSLRQLAEIKIGQSRRQRPPERAIYGDCPETPYPRLRWVQAGELLRRMQLLNAQMASTLNADRYDVNKFLDWLLGLPVQSQAALFDFYFSVFKWVVCSAKANGKLEPSIEFIAGESAECDGSACSISCVGSS
jgi:hypothetical protein